MIAFVVDIFEHMQTWLVFWVFKSQEVCFEVGLVAPSHVSIISQFI